MPAVWKNVTENCNEIARLRIELQDISVFCDISVLLRTSRKIFPQRVATGLRSHKNDFWNNIRAFCCRRKTVLKLPLLQIKDFK